MASGCTPPRPCKLFKRSANAFGIKDNITQMFAVSKKNILWTLNLSGLSCERWWTSRSELNTRFMGKVGMVEKIWASVINDIRV